uniref:Sm domain-containing protein n=1 Tax=Amphimedon queenslandica TaxID=400682 RepID=A0A1X7VC31_AMPQE
MATSSKKQSLRTLLCFLQGLQNCKTTVELRNEITIKGTIVNVDDKMNTTISGAEYKYLDGTVMNCENLFIQGSQIRYVHIPDDIDPMTLLNKIVDEESEREIAPFSKQKVSDKKLTRIEEEKKMVRDYVMGKGRRN